MSIYPLKRDGKLTGKWRVEIQINGRRARGVFATIEEARAAEANWTKGLPEVAIVRESRAGGPKTLKDLYNETKGSLWKGKAYRETAEKRLWRVIELIGPNESYNVSTVALDTVVRTLEAEGLSGSTINKYLSAFHKLLEWGRPRHDVILPEFPYVDEDEGRIRWLTFQEEHKLLALLPEDVRRMVRVAIQTGMRRGEFYTIRPEDVQQGWLHIWKTKTGHPRSIPITGVTQRDLVYLFEVGMPSIERLRYWWDHAQTKMNLSHDKWFTFHITRHTCATRMVQANVHLRAIQKWLGHKSIQTTLRYAQVSEEVLSDALTTLENYRSGVVDTSLHVGYTPETPVLGLSNDNRRVVKINQSTARSDGYVRGRGEIGRHAGFRFQWVPEQSQDDQDET